MDFRARLWGINPTNSAFILQSFVLRSIVWILIYWNWSINKLKSVFSLSVIFYSIHNTKVSFTYFVLCSVSPISLVAISRSTKIGKARRRTKICHVLFSTCSNRWSFHLQKWNLETLCFRCLFKHRKFYSPKFWSACIFPPFSKRHIFAGLEGIKFVTKFVSIRRHGLVGMQKLFLISLQWLRTTYISRVCSQSFIKIKFSSLKRTANNEIF